MLENMFRDLEGNKQEFIVIFLKDFLIKAFQFFMNIYVKDFYEKNLEMLGIYFENFRKKDF